MQKYVIIQLLEQVEDGTQFPMTKWPLHITLAPNFVIDMTVSELNAILDDFCKKHSVVDAIVGEDDNFGPQGRVRVTKLHMNTDLMSLHQSLVDTLRVSGAIFDEPQYIEEGFVAIATIQDDSRLKKGELISITKLSLVDMFADNDICERKLLKTVSLQ